MIHSFVLSVIPSLSRDQFSRFIFRKTELILRLRCATLRMTVVAGFVLALCSCSSGVTANKISQIKPAMKVDQVEALLGRPAHIDQAETTGLRGETYHYPASNGEGRVVILNDTVFKAEFIPGDKKS
jgi:hypothetical protein